MQKQSGIIIQGNELKKHGYYVIFSVSNSWYLLIWHNLFYFFLILCRFLLSYYTVVLANLLRFSLTRMGRSQELP
jgi:hypothetical protein